MLNKSCLIIQNYNFKTHINTYKVIMQTQKILNACQVLFGDNTLYSINFLEGLDKLELKTAYRKKVMETHPDRAKTLGINENIMKYRFQNVISAYNLLTPFIEKKKMILNNNTKDEPQKATKSASEKSRIYEKFHKGKIPRKKLLLGQFLYYSGIISFKTLLAAIAWQRSKRPCFGKIAKDWNFLTNNNISTILTKRGPREKMGEYALNNGYINAFQFMAVLGRQRMLQPLFGDYFVKKRILSPRQLEDLNQKAMEHNMRIKNSAYKFKNY